jgi:5-enolpyruvylshikimate-3-phosphate synthase
MRMLLIAAIAAGTFTITMTASSNDAQSVVCARGVYRAGCAGPHGAVVVHRPAVVHHGVVCRRYGYVQGVRRCVLY